MIDLNSLFDKRPLIIAGPCSAETEEQTIETARQLAANGIKVFRAGIWKPRTRPGNFEGGTGGCTAQGSFRSRRPGCSGKRSGIGR